MEAELLARALPVAPLASARVDAYYREWWEKWLTRDQGAFDNAWLGNNELKLIARERRQAVEWWAEHRRGDAEVARHERKRHALTAWLNENFHALGTYIDYKHPDMRRQLAEWVQELGVSRDEIIHYIRRQMLVRRRAQPGVPGRPLKHLGKSSASA
jgi:hypothetical protein